MILLDEKRLLMVVENNRILHLNPESTKVRYKQVVQLGGSEPVKIIPRYEKPK